MFQKLLWVMWDKFGGGMVPSLEVSLKRDNGLTVLGDL